jgi:transposase
MTRPSTSSPTSPGLSPEEQRRLLAENAELKATVAELTALVAKLLKNVEELKAKLGQNSSNSDLPPSQDPPGAPPPVKKKRSRRKRGGQPGHKGHHRALLPPERVDETIPIKPDHCRRCRASLSGTDPEPRRHQVTEVPEPRAVVIEWQLHRLRCGGCGAVTCADLPAGVPTGAFGPRLQAVVGVCTGIYHVSARLTQDLLSELHQVPISLGSIHACQQAVSKAVATAVDEAQAFAQAATVKHADETGWKQAGKRAWLWVFATASVTVFMIHAKRSSEAAKDLLGAAGGVLVTDRWSAYSWWPLALRQLCWSHLKRDFQKISEQSAETRQLGRDLLAATKWLFRWWRQVKAGAMDRAAFQERVKPLRGRVEQLLEDGSRFDNKKVAGMCRAIHKLAPAMWTFVDTEGVEPTNNFGERQIRPAVLWRKGSFGTQSNSGSLYVARVMTVAATLKQQGRSALAYLTAACRAANAYQPGPSLIPLRESSAA